MATDRPQKKELNKNKRKQKYGLLVHLIFLAIASITAIFLCCFIGFKYMELKKDSEHLNTKVSELQNEVDKRYTEEQVLDIVAKKTAEVKKQTEKEVREDTLSGIKESLMSDGKLLDSLKVLYPDDIIVMDKGYCFVPIRDDLKHHSYVSSQFIKDEDGFMQYQVNGEILSKRGIDVSTYQGKIDWSKVASEGIDYAFIRVGVRGYTKGDILPDESFETNIAGANKAGIDAGVYFVTQAISVDEAEAEAEYILDQIEPYRVTYPIVIDVEDIENADPRSGVLTPEERTECVLAFCNVIRQAGYEPMIYGNLKSFLRMLEFDKLEDIKKWIAYYDDELYFPYEFDVWQYTDKGSISGIKDTVDYNISFYNAD